VGRASPPAIVAERRSQSTGPSSPIAHSERQVAISGHRPHGSHPIPPRRTHLGAVFASGSSANSKGFRAIATRHDKRASTFLAAIELVSVPCWLA
jgi:hypothetical protein